MKNILFFTSIFLSLFIGGCNKSEIQTQYYNHSDRQRAMASFKVGSYWLMRDSITGRVDSFVVTERKNYFDTHNIDNISESYETTYFVFSQYIGGNINLNGVISFVGYEGQNIIISNKSSSCIIYYNYNYFKSDNIFINNNSYDSVGISSNKENGNFRYDTTSLFKAYINPDKILLKVIYQNDSVYKVWELEKAVLYR